MASVPQNLVGRKVYSSGSYAPTRGTVKPTGYIKRELKKRGRRNPKTAAAQLHLKNMLKARKLRGK